MKRRALSTIVGAVFFVIVMGSTISYVAYSMNLIDDLARSVDVKQNENLNKQNEDFDVLNVKIQSNNKFNITLYNKGNIPIEITRLYIENTTATNWNVTKYDIGTEIAPGEIKSNIGPNLSLTYVDTESYLLKFVTSRGNSESVSINSGGGQLLHTNLYALPDVIPMGFNTVLLYEVVNNSTGQLVNIVPIINETKICSGCNWTPNGGWQPASYPSLNPGEVATFQKSYTLDGEDGDIFLFNASLANAYSGVWDQERVDLQLVSESAEAGVSITAQGIGATGSDPLSLVLHEETVPNPDPLENIADQLSSTSADGGNDGTVLQYDTAGEFYDWFTNNSTDTIFLDGTNPWTAALRYHSDPVPPSFGANTPHLIYHFDNDDYPNTMINSQGDTDRDLIPCVGKIPTQSTGMHGTSGYDFDGTQCLQSSQDVDGSDFNDIDDGNDATAFWFKTNGAMSGSDQYFVNFEDSGPNPEYYRVYMTDPGHIEFEYKAKHPSEVLTCTSINEYDDSVWHHVVAVRSDSDNTDTCELYIDYHEGVLDREYVLNTGGNFNKFIDTDGRWTVGANKAQTGNFFNGDIDVVMHWDDFSPTVLGSTEAADLAKTHYGAQTHKIGFAIIKTRYDGSPHQQTPFQYTTTMIPFHDSMGSTDTNDNSFGFFNNTMNVNDITLEPANSHRLNFTIAFESSNSTWSNLGFDLKIDDENISPYTSYIQLPAEPTNPIPGYETFDKDDEMEFFFENGGERGFRFTFAGTRLVFNATDGSGSYGAIPCAVGGDCEDGDFQLRSEQDSMQINPGTQSYIKFYQATTVPSHSPEKGVRMTPGLYKGAVWVFGYDDEGFSFEKTFDLGIVTITD